MFISIITRQHCLYRRDEFSMHQCSELKIISVGLWRNLLVHAEIYIYRVLQTIQMKLILLCVWAELAILGSAKTALKFKYEIQID